MRALILVILGMGWGAWAAEELWAPTAQLFTKTIEGREEISGLITVEMIDPQSPTCAMVFARVKFLEKQIHEIESSSDRGETAELVELRRRLLQVKGTLARPWVKLSARFQVREEVVKALEEKRASVGFEIATRSWFSPQGFLPEDVQLKILDEKQISFDWTWDAYQYCKETSGLILKIETASPFLTN